VNEPSENQSREAPIRKSGIIMFLLLFFVVIFAAFFVYVKSQNIDLKDVNIKELIANIISPGSGQTQVKKYAEIKYDSNEYAVFGVYKDLIIKCMKNKIQGIDKNGDEVWSIPVTMNEPVMKTSENDLLVADIGGRDIYVINGKEIKWSTKTDNNIINADISKTGYVTVVKEEKRTRGAVTVYNLQGNEFFTKGIGESFVLMAKVSPSGKQVFINSIDTSGVKADTILEVTDILGKSVSANKIAEEGTIYTSMWYLNNDSLITAGDDSMVCFDKSGKESWNTKKLFPSIKVFSSTVSLDKYPVLAFGSSNSNAAQVVLMNQKGDKVSQYQMQGEVVNISTFSDLLAVNAGREVDFINTKGSLIGKYSSKSDIIGVNFFSKQEAEIVTKGSVVVTNVKG
jgi:hypothetical protein